MKERDTRPRATLSDVRDLGTVPLWPHAADLLSISRTSVYARAADGSLPTIKVGKRLLVPVPALRRMLGDTDAA
jgi:hypothetical protein